MKDAQKHDYPKEFMTQEIINALAIYKLAWTKEDWREYFSKRNDIAFRPIPTGLIFDPQYALLSNPAKLALNYALTQVIWKSQKNNRRNLNRTNPNIAIDAFMMPIAALEALAEQALITAKVVHKFDCFGDRLSEDELKNLTTDELIERLAGIKHERIFDPSSTSPVTGEVYDAKRWIRVATLKDPSRRNEDYDSLKITTGT